MLEVIVFPLLIVGMIQASLSEVGSIIRKHKFNIKILSRNFIPHAFGWSIHCNLMAAIQFKTIKARATKPARGISFSHDILPRLTR